MCVCVRSCATMYKCLTNHFALTIFSLFLFGFIQFFLFQFIALRDLLWISTTAKNESLVKIWNHQLFWTIFISPRFFFSSLACELIEMNCNVNAEQKTTTTKQTTPNESVQVEYFKFTRFQFADDTTRMRAYRTNTWMSHSRTQFRLVVNVAVYCDGVVKKNKIQITTWKMHKINTLL